MKHTAKTILSDKEKAAILREVLNEMKTNLKAMDQQKSAATTASILDQISAL